MGTVLAICIILLIALFIFRKRGSSGRSTSNVAYSKKDAGIIGSSAQRIAEVMNESLHIASESTNPETIISRLGVAKEKLAQVERMVEEYPYITLENTEQVKRDIAKFEEKIRPLTSSYPVEAVSEVKLLKRDGKNTEAIALLNKCIDSMEAAATEVGGVAPWYYEQLAILYRKEKRLEDELEVLERYSRQPKAPGAGPQKLKERLVKVKAKLNK